MIAADIRPPSWHSRAACRGAGAVMFDPSRTAEAKAICARCPVVAACLATALDRPETAGTWGGRAEAERVAIRAGRCAHPAETGERA